MTGRQISLPAGVAGIGGGEALPDGEGGAIAVEGLGEVALGAEHVADLVLRNREVALPAGVAGIGRGSALADVNRVLTMIREGAACRRLWWEFVPAKKGRRPEGETAGVDGGGGA
jgi:hypothetical protein